MNKKHNTISRPWLIVIDEGKNNSQASKNAHDHLDKLMIGVLIGVKCNCNVSYSHVEPEDRRHPMNNWEYDICKQQFKGT